MAATRYSAMYPAGADPRDVVRTAVANLPSPPDRGPQFDDGPPPVCFVIYLTTTLTAAQQTTFQNAVAATAADPNAPWRVADNLDNAIDVAKTRLRTIQTQAAAFAGQTDYAAANLSALNDLLHKSQSIANAVNDIALIELRIIRKILGQLDATT